MSEQPTLILDASQVAVEPGSEATLGLKVRNKGTIVDHFSLEVLGPASAWTVVEPNVVRLFPGNEERARVRFRPPRSWKTSAGYLTVGIRAESSADDDQSAVEEVELEISAFREISAELRPRTSRGRRKGRHRIYLHSTSNLPVDVSLSANELDGESRLRVKPDEVRLEPGRGRRASLTVRPVYTPWFGPASENYTFEARALPKGGSEVTMQGGMRQSALLPRSIPTLGGLLFLALAGLALYAFMGPRLGLPTVLPSNQPVSVATATPSPTAKPGTWSAGKPMGTPRDQQTMTKMKDGRVLVTGGYKVSGNSLASLETTEIYDANGQGWVVGPPMSIGRAAHSGTLLKDGRVLIVGGAGQNDVAVASAEVYDPAANKWTPAGQLKTARYSQQAIELDNGKVIVIGGRTSNGAQLTAVASTELWDPATNTWAAGPNLTVPRSDLTATKLLDGRILVVGGDNAPSTPTQSGAVAQSVAELIDANGTTVTATASMAKPRADQSATLLQDGRVLVVGGSLESPRAEVFTPNPSGGVWAAVAEPAAARRFHSAVRLGSGQVLVTGGAANAALASVETYNPATNKWTSGNAMSAPRWEHESVVLDNGQVLVTGGNHEFSKGAPALTTTELFQPLTS